MNRSRLRICRPSNLHSFSFAIAFLALAGTSLANEGSQEVRARVEGLLSQARQAMATGNLKQANQLVKQAESFDLSYPTLHFGDTPERARRDLQGLMATRPGYHATSSPEIAKSTATTTNPTAKKLEASNLFADTEQSDSVANLAVPNSHSTTDITVQARHQLLLARRALSVGDAAQAQKFVIRAEQFGASFSPAEDSPQRVKQSIAMFETLKATKADSPSWRQGYAKFLVEQASNLAQHGDLDNAEKVAYEAEGLQAVFGDSEKTPKDIHNLIAAGRSSQQVPQSRPLPNQPISKAKSQSMALMAEARAALQSGNLVLAEQLASQASLLNVEESQFAASEDSPARLALDLQRARAEAEATQLATSNIHQGQGLPMFDTPQDEVPHIAAAPEHVPTPLPTITDEQPSTNVDAQSLVSKAESALRSGSREEALRLLRLAKDQSEHLDPATLKRVQDHLQMLQGTDARSSASGRGNAGSLLNTTDSEVRVLATQLSAEVTQQQLEAGKLRTTDPEGALKLLDDISQKVADSQLQEYTKRQLISRIGMTKSRIEQYIRDNKGELELEATNRRILDDIERDKQVKLQVQERLAELNDQYNQLRSEQRYAEMELVAKRAVELAPNEIAAQMMWSNAKFIRREMLNKEINDDAEEGVYGMLSSVQRTKADANLHGDKPIDYDVEFWKELADRKGSSSSSSRLTPTELEIKQKLRSKILVNFEDAPLSEVVDQLSELTGVNIYLDPRGLGQEGVRSDTTVSLTLKNEVSLESALNLILPTLHLTHMVDDEVLKITSEQIRDGEVYTKVYNVSDLVIPIPNFVPSSDIGLQGLINDAYAALPQNVRNYGPAPVSYVPQAPGVAAADAMVPGGVLPQQFAAPTGGSSVDYGGGPGQLGGAANADFDSLIDLIVSTVEHDSWMENGTGDGEIQPFPTNLSLVISQTQRVHEQISDLLEQLRRLQDLQVTIEVRFIRLSDSFFERIGIDFDFNIEDGTGISDIQADVSNPTNPTEPTKPSATVGIQAGPTNGPLGSFTADLDIPYRSNSFDLSAPQFGTPAEVASFGFAILSDIEAYFLIEASQGDRRTNLLNAPKVTLFNGQQALVVDSVFRPFVISVIPVVGEFAAAQQPVIVVLSEGTMLSVQAVVSDDRRYVRLTLVPFFSQIGNVETFTFEGSETTSTSSGSADEDDDGNDESNDAATEIIRSGTTVQLPEFQVISVSTTVSVPDGGTVLLGGIKRLQEGRDEFGVPMLSKIPYIDRLFRNVGIGRDTDSLMMMVTPHIIIQEEEEERLGIE